ncbi:hypothetical protein [Vibrio sp. St2]|uniref:hypothetical protein n=1 Tax=Vibrio sp. St2 TaxID=2853441 RepID=UPI00248F2A31|nr:hypothetical protein [Vibrio sp. St2]
MTIPTQISAGTSVSWSFEHELADGTWQFTYCLRGMPEPIDIEAASAGGSVSVTKTAKETENWKAGTYECRLFASKGDDNQLIEITRVVIDPDFSKLTAGHDPRSHAERMLESIDKVLEGRPLSDHEEYSIEGRSIKRIPIKELHSLRKVYAQKVKREKNGGKLSIGKIVHRFRSPRR